MTEVLLFHHALGLTPGVHAFADRLRAAGHTVHTPDLFEGRTFDTVEDGVAHVQQLGFDTIEERGVAAAEDLPDDLVHAGLSLGAVPAVRLAATRRGALGLVLLHGVVDPPDGASLPTGLPVQVHASEHDPEFDNGYDRPAAEALVTAGGPGSELFLYPGEAHLFTESTSPEYDAGATDLAAGRVLELLAR